MRLDISIPVSYNKEKDLYTKLRKKILQIQVFLLLSTDRSMSAVSFVEGRIVIGVKAPQHNFGGVCRD